MDFFFFVSEEVEVTEFFCHFRTRDIRWRQHLDVKRKQENSLNEQRLLEARRKFVQSQNLLRQLIQEKDQKRQEALGNANRKKGTTTTTTFA